jgi:hypothetical protein
MGLLLSSGCDVVTRDQLSMVPCVPKSDTHEPVKHIDFLESIEKGIERTGYIKITGSEHGVSHDGERFFSFMDIVTKKTESANGHILDGDVKLQIIARNANDMQFKANISGGTTTMCCDNLAFWGNLMDFGHENDRGQRRGRKHTANIHLEMPQLLDDAFGRLVDQVDSFEARYRHYKGTPVSDRQMHDLVCRALDATHEGREKKAVITTSFVYPVLKEWHDSQFAEFRNEKNAWGAFSAFTSAGTKGTNRKPIPINEQAIRTQNLHEIFDDFCDYGFNRIYN